jgi:hypothetical protein
MTINDKDQVTWTSEMPDRRKNNRRTIENRRRMSGAKSILKISNLRDNDDRRMTDRRKVKLTITGRAVEVKRGDAKD